MSQDGTTGQNLGHLLIFVFAIFMESFAFEKQV